MNSSGDFKPKTESRLFGCEIDYAALLKTSNRIKDDKIKQIILDLLDRFKKECEHFNILLAIKNEPITDDDFSQLRQIISISESQIAKEDGDFNCKLLARAIVRYLLEAIIVYSNKHCPVPIKVKKVEPDWQEHNLRLQQNLLSNMSSNIEIQKAFETALSEIKQIITKHYCAKTIIVDYLPTEEYTNWTHPFLTQLRNHLRDAGFGPIDLITNSPPTDYKEIMNADYVLIVGTEDYLKNDNHTSLVRRQAAVSSRFNDLNPNHKTIFFLISGDMASSFPPKYQGFNCWNWKNYTYLINLKILMKYLINQDKLDKPIDNVFQKFMDKIKKFDPDAHLLLDKGFSKEVILIHVKDEKRRHEIACRKALNLPLPDIGKLSITHSSGFAGEQIESKDSKSQPTKDAPPGGLAFR